MGTGFDREAAARLRCRLRRFVCLLPNLFHRRNSIKKGTINKINILDNLRFVNQSFMMILEHTEFK